jgi:hypothetical protein
MDMLQAVVDNLLTEEAVDASHILLVNVDIFTDPQKLIAAVLLIPDSKGMDELMKRLFGEGWQDL